VDALGYVADTTAQAHEEFFPGYAHAFTKVRAERGWPPVTRRQADALVSRHVALLVGGPEDIAAKIREHSDALGGITRISFQMDVAALPNAKLMRAIELLGTRVAPALRGAA
jgi:alkanesulfonate monooxygenase SsuD/methylene tetrahydromethanopterin reductase-like flavin-dependent oxidoreductase (luciferase family)